MRLKKLSMIGFKSFMGKIEIPFPIGISAVVGPNGCGKSNIVDAIRWAMGEQSAKQLRGRQMEDIIFNGAGEHKALGMAEVSIVLENGDGSFPSEFARETEISITRRLYRSGESEYLVNSVPCRLKDVQELFMDTGLGNRAYSIIGQGRIGSIIDQKPEETRMMLEEAAGITRFKKKEAESRRKMELAKRNLERVEDILVEVESQMRSLKRQASKARRFKTIGREIQRLELVLYANIYHEFREESESKTKSRDDLLQKEVELMTGYSAIQAENEARNMELDEKDKGIASYRDNYLRIKEEYNRNESAIESIAGEKKMQEELENRLRQEKEDIGKRLSRLAEEKTGLFKKSEEIEGTTNTLKEDISLVEKRLKSRKDLLDEIRQEYERVGRGVSSDATREAGLTQESGYLNKRIGEIMDSRARMEKEKQDLNVKSEELLDVSRKKNELRQALVKKYEDVERDISEIEHRCEELTGIEKSVEKNLKNAEAELNISQTRLSSLKSLTENFEGYQLGVRTIMKAKDRKDGKIGHILGIVADMIQVEPEYEQAVEAVLADKLQCIIVESHEDAREAVDYLRSMAKGKSSFVPLRELPDARPARAKHGFPLLREFVTVPDPYGPMMDLLLGNTLLAQTMEEAILEWRNNGKDHGLVTPAGDMIDTRGIISGGKFAQGTHGLLARKREIKELEEKSRKYGKETRQLQDRLDGVRQEIETKKESLNGLYEEKWDCRDKVNDLDKTIFRLSHELDQIEKLLEKISGEFEQKTREQARHGEELEKIQRELQLCSETKRKQEEYLLKKRLELKENEDEYDEIRAELEKLRMDLNLSMEEKKGILREIGRIDDFHEEAEEKLEKIAGEILSIHQRKQEYSEREETLKEELRDCLKRLRLAEEAVDLAQQERNALHAEIRGREKRAEALREELDLLKEKINLAKMEQSEIRIKMENIASLVEERFNTDLVHVYREHLLDDFNAADTRAELENQKTLLERLGDVNLTAIQEHEALKERHEFIQAQRQDLLKSIDSIMQVIRKINKTCRDRFMETFEEADNKIKQVFPILFNGGTAGLKLMDEKNPLESGVLVEVRPPGKKLSHMGLLSGGEKALVAMTLLFAIYLIKPSPFCLLDEVDAPLDEANIDRFNNLLKEIRKYSQVVLVTHNRRSMEIVDSLFGVTMENAGVSKMVSVNLSGNERN